MRSPSTGMKVATERIDHAFHTVCHSIRSLTAGMARTTLEGARIVTDTAHFRLAIETATGTLIPALPVPGPDGPIALSGRKALDDLITRYPGRLAFHGSANLLRRIEPRQSSWSIDGVRYPDGDPAVSADTDYSTPMLFALFKRRAGTSYKESPDGSVTYMVTGTSIDRIPEYTGYVHVLDRAKFQPMHLPAPDGWPHPLDGPRFPELRSADTVEPFAVVRVSLEDFPHTINGFGT